MHSRENMVEWVMNRWRYNEVMVSDFNMVLIPKLGGRDQINL
jgi:hypothetical protein